VPSGDGGGFIQGGGMPQTVIETVPAEPELTEEEPAVTDEALVAEELLVEEVSIDGMCGVY
jgi:mycofactocin precursor